VCVCVCVCVCVYVCVCVDLEVNVYIARFVGYGKTRLKKMITYCDTLKL